MLFPSFEEVQALSAQFTLIPVSFTFAADHCSPLGMYQALAEGEPYALLLEGDFAANGRYAIAAAAPALTVRMENAAVSLKNGEEWAALPDAAPADFLHTLRNACTSPACQPFFSGGLTGCCPDAQGSNGLLCQFQELAVYDRMNETITIVLPIHSTADQVRSIRPPKSVRLSWAHASTAIGHSPSTGTTSRPSMRPSPSRSMILRSTRSQSTMPPTALRSIAVSAT